MLIDKLTTIGATLRLTRLVVRDDLGDWTLYRPAETWAIKHDGTGYHDRDQRPVLDERAGWRSKLVSGLACPFCVGFWLGAGVLAADVATRGTRLEPGWRFAKSALTLNYATAHVASRLDGPSDD